MLFFLYILPDPLSSTIGMCTLYTTGCRIKPTSVALSLGTVRYLIWHMWTNLTVMKHLSDTLN